MQARLTTKPEQQVISAIQALDLESVKVRLMDPEVGEGWTREYADSIEVAYKTYLTMVVKYQDHAEDILLSKDVDEFWHTHILQTMKYTDDCEAVFGKYLHHAPHIGEITSEDARRREAQADKTRQLYEREFGGAQNAETAWFGASVKAEYAEIPDSDIKIENAAVSAKLVRKGIAAANAAISAVFANRGITAGKAAISAVFAGRGITAESAAISAVFAGRGITAGNAAISAVFSGRAITAGNAAISAVFVERGINAENAAISAVFVNKESAAENAAVVA